MLLTAVNFTFYVGYDRYMSDIGNPGVTDALFTMLLLMSYDSLARGARWAWAVSVLMATLVLYAGPVMFVLSVAAMVLWKPIPRRQTLRWAATAGGLLLATAVFYAIWGWCDGSLRYWIDTLDQEYMNHYLAQTWIKDPAWPKTTSVTFPAGFPPRFFSDASCWGPAGLWSSESSRHCVVMRGRGPWPPSR